MARTLDEQLSQTYLTLRVTVATLAFMLPPLLAFAGSYAFQISLRPSMSDYYWASKNYQTPPCALPTTTSAASKIIELVDIPPGSMRNYFVGFLFAVGALLFCYKGFTWEENAALNFAGAMAWGIALCPMDWTCAHPAFNKHGTFAVLFFLSIAYVAFFRAKDTLHLLANKKARKLYRYAYDGLATMMVIAPFTAYALDIHSDNHTAIFWVELWGIYTFAIYWLVKMTEVAKIGEKRSVEEHSNPGPLKIA